MIQEEILGLLEVVETAVEGLGGVGLTMTGMPSLEE